MNTKLHVLHTGKVYVDQALAYKEKTLHPMAYSGWFRSKKKKNWVPVSAYLIEHEKGLVLIDTGWHEDIRIDQKKHLGRIPHSMYKGQLPEGESIIEQLNELGYTDYDLDYVILTHLHSDHVSGLKHVKNAKMILTSEPEWDTAQKDKLRYIASMWEGVNINTFPLEQIPFGPYKQGLDLFQDGTVYLVYTPGHSNGQISVLVKTSKGWVLLASDVGYSERSWKESLLPGVTTSKKKAKKSLEWVKEFSSRDDCYQVLANHDPMITPQVVQ